MDIKEGIEYAHELIDAWPNVPTIKWRFGQDIHGFALAYCDDLRIRVYAKPGTRDFSVQTEQNLKARVQEILDILFEDLANDGADVDAAFKVPCEFEVGHAKRCAVDYYCAYC